MPYMANFQALLKNWVQSNLFYSITDSNVGVVLSLRRRTTIAEINAGGTLIPAPGVGFKIRVINATMVAIGGSAAGATLVRLTGTRAAAAVVIFSAAVARLAQSVINVMGTPFATAGAESLTSLADGASLTALDENTAVTYDKTGASLTTSTHVDFTVLYVIEHT